MLIGGSRLGPGLQIFDLPARYQSLRAQPGGLQTGNEIDERGTGSRPQEPSLTVDSFRAR
jgi:hypothetical protein